MARPQPADQVPLAHYPIQLAGAYVHQATIRRTVPGEGEPREMTFNALIRGVAPDRGGKHLAVVFGGRVTVPYADNALLTVSCDITGEFIAASRRKKAELEAFGNREAVLILWPFLRASIAQLGVLTGLSIPPIPLVDVLAMIEAQKLRGAPQGSRKSRKRTVPQLAAEVGS